MKTKIEKDRHLRHQFRRSHTTPIPPQPCRLSELHHCTDSIILTMDVGDEQQKAFCWTGQFGHLVLLLHWRILHFIISICYCVRGIANVLESYLDSSGYCGLLKRYKVVNLDKLRYLAVVVDNDEAHETSKVTELLQWLAAVGVKNVCLYDTEGVLRKSKEAILGRLHVAKLFKVLSSCFVEELIFGQQLFFSNLWRLVCVTSAHDQSSN
ncbi:ditrans,polycis-polyprenyl diphosphate synthase [(2E,6E)-farnesyl] [Sarracenia purpurea var. burkii]